MLARIENGGVAELRSIDMNDIPVHKRAGWLPVEGDQPACDGRIEYLEGPIYTVEADRVVRSWNKRARVPDAVTNYQARAALISAGLFDTVNAAMLALPANAIERQAWEYANTFSRSSPIITALGAQLNLTSEQIDGLFLAAAQVT